MLGGGADRDERIHREILRLGGFGGTYWRVITVSSSSFLAPSDSSTDIKMIW